MPSENKTRITAVRRPTSTAKSSCLVLIYPTGNQMGKRFSLDVDKQYIGRGADCAVQIDLDSVSRRHALVSVRGSRITIRDLDSTNGTYVNEQPITEHALQSGDLVQIGNAIFKFLTGGNIESDYHEAIYRMTIIDGLTEAHNKRYLLDYLEREVARAVRYERPLSLVMFDIDHFKQLNDTHGHLTGDHVLREMARRISSRIRREELLARYGGEEFAVVLPEAGHAGAIKFAEQLRRLVGDQPMSYEGDELGVTVSVGVATLHGQPLQLNEFIKQADDNLYKAKRGGRNRVVG